MGKVSRLMKSSSGVSPSKSGVRTSLALNSANGISDGDGKLLKAVFESWLSEMSSSQVGIRKLAQFDS